MQSLDRQIIDLVNHKIEKKIDHFKSIPTLKQNPFIKKKREQNKMNKSQMHTVEFM